MRILGEIDAHNYSQYSNEEIRVACRAIVLKDKKIFLVHSMTKGYYKFPGGGLEKDETFENCVLRELKEEAGLLGVAGSVEPYGSFKEIRTSNIYKECKFTHISHYFFVNEVLDKIVAQDLEGYESELKYKLELVTYEEAVEANRKYLSTKDHKCNIDRENAVLDLLKKEGYID